MSIIDKIDEKHSMVPVLINVNHMLAKRFKVCWDIQLAHEMENELQSQLHFLCNFEMIFGVRS